VRTGAEILQFPIGTEAMDAFFTEDGRRILVTTAEGDVRDYDVSWSMVLDHDLKSRVCREKNEKAKRELNFQPRPLEWLCPTQPGP
jgi:hypothetical protein